MPKKKQSFEERFDIIEEWENRELMMKITITSPKDNPGKFIVFIQNCFIKVQDGEMIAKRNRTITMNTLAKVQFISSLFPKIEEIMKSPPTVREDEF